MAKILNDSVIGSSGISGPELSVSNNKPLTIEELGIRIRKNIDITNYAPPGQTNAVLMSININSGHFSNSLKSMELTNTGDATPINDISRIRLWIDNGPKMNDWDAQDIFICYLYWDNVSSRWTNHNILFSSNLKLPGRNFILTVDIKSNANSTRIFNAKIPANGLKGTGNAEGPFSDIINYSSLIIEEEMIYVSKNSDILQVIPPDRDNITIMAINLFSGHYSNRLTGINITNTGDAIAINDYNNMTLWLDNGTESYTSSRVFLL